MRCRLLLIAAACASSLSLAAPAHAEPGDGAYGRLKGDLTLVVGVGGGLVAKSDRKLVTGDLRVRYLDAVGVALTYEEADAFKSSTVDHGDVHRSFISALEIRPLFPIRFLRNKES